LFDWINNFLHYNEVRSWGISVSIAMGYRLDGGCSIPNRGRLRMVELYLHSMSLHGINPRITLPKHLLEGAEEKHEKPQKTQCPIFELEIIACADLRGRFSVVLLSP
jgi:hypothetical protein